MFGERITDAAILAARGAKNLVDPFRPYHMLVEPEWSADRVVEDVATVFLSNRECPFRCLMCDLWKNTTDEKVPVGAISEQIRFALDQLPVAQQLNRLKTNNSDSIQELISAMQNVLTAQGENDVFIERTSPLSISGRPVRTMTLLISGPNPQQLLTCHTTLQQFVKRASPGIK